MIFPCNGLIECLFGGHISPRAVILAAYEKDSRPAYPVRGFFGILKICKIVNRPIMNASVGIVILGKVKKGEWQQRMHQ